MPVRAHLVWLSLAALATFAAALVFPVFHGSLGADDSPTTTWNFEDEADLDDWIGVNATLDISPGNGVGETNAVGVMKETSQRADILHSFGTVPGGSYTFGGYYTSTTGDIDRVIFEIAILRTQGDPAVEISSILFLPSTDAGEVAVTATCDAVSGELRVFVVGTKGSTAYFDDLYLKEGPPSTPCPTLTPTATSTHTPSVTLTATATATPTDTATPLLVPPSTSTLAPANTSTPQATSTDAGTPTVVATTAPAVALEFANGGFERGAGGEPDAWETIGGVLIQSGSPVRGGSWSGAFFSSTGSTKWAYQTVSVEPTNWYTFAAFIYHDDVWVESALLRISWYASTDGSGSAVATVDSTAALASPKPSFRLLTTGQVMTPPGVHSARLRVLMRPVGQTNAVIYIDDVSFDKTGAPMPPTATPTSTVIALPMPTDTPRPTVTDTPVPTSTVAALPTPAPTSSPAAQTGAPLRLTNAGFEIGEDGVPAGWRTFGGLLTKTDAPVRSGTGTGAFFSSSSSTKWLYQTVVAEPEAWYQLDAFVYHNHAWVESVLLRISWYASDDGSGSAMLSVDSTASLDIPAPGYRRLTTGPVQAPPGARSAKLRILLRPRDGTSASIYIDDVSFDRVAAPAYVEEAAPVSDRPATSGRTSQVLSSFAPAPTAATDQQPSYTPMPAPVIRRYTLRTPEQLAAPREGDPLWPWALFGATAGVGAVGWAAYWVLRRRQGVR